MPGLARQRQPAVAKLLAWQVAAQRVFKTHAGRYGHRQLRAQLRHESHAVRRQRPRGGLIASGLHILGTCANTSPRYYPGSPTDCGCSQ